MLRVALPHLRERPFVPDRDRSGGAVQHACNTRFEFVLTCSGRLDKITIWQHPASRIAETVRFDFD
jgi:hypothetical protein